MADVRRGSRDRLGVLGGGDGPGAGLLLASILGGQQGQQGGNDQFFQVLLRDLLAQKQDRRIAIRQEEASQRDADEQLSQFLVTQGLPPDLTREKAAAAIAGRSAAGVARQNQQDVAGTDLVDLRAQDAAGGPPNLLRDQTIALQSAQDPRGAQVEVTPDGLSQTAGAITPLQQLAPGAEQAQFLKGLAEANRGAQFQGDVKLGPEIEAARQTQFGPDQGPPGLRALQDRISSEAEVASQARPSRSQSITPGKGQDPFKVEAKVVENAFKSRSELADQVLSFSQTVSTLDLLVDRLNDGEQDKAKGISDTVLMNVAFRGFIDPDVSVRDVDIRGLLAGMGLRDRIALLPEQLKAGDRLTPAARQVLADLARERLQVAQQALNTITPAMFEAARAGDAEGVARAFDLAAGNPLVNLSERSAGSGNADPVGETIEVYDPVKREFVRVPIGG